MTLSEIIKRLEAGETGREVDAHIHERDAPSPDWERWIIGGPVGGYVSPMVPTYTTSLDAAMTLVPEGWRVTHAYWDDEFAAFNLGLGRSWREGKAKTPALALVLAALKAREAQS